MDSTPQQEQKVKEEALRILDRRRRTRHELEQRLREKNYSLETVHGVLDRLQEVGLIDDLEYARIFLRDRLRRKAVAERVVRGQLAGRGVAGDLIDQAMAELNSESDAEGPVISSETERARKAALELDRRYHKLDPAVRLRRLTAALARRGFRYEIISRVVKSGNFPA